MRAEAIIPCQHYCFNSAPKNLRSTERFYSRGVWREGELPPRERNVTQAGYAVLTGTKTERRQTSDGYSDGERINDLVEERGIYIYSEGE